MNGKKLVAIFMIGAVCCSILAGTVTCVINVCSNIVKVIDIVATRCCNTVETLVDTIVES